MYDPTYKKWKLIDIIYAKILPPYYNNLFLKDILNNLYKTTYK